MFMHLDENIYFLVNDYVKNHLTKQVKHNTWPLGSLGVKIALMRN